MRLFVERAQAANPEFCLTDANAGAVATICHHLDGLPLAIELAAARVRLLPPPVLLQRLMAMPGRLTMLTGGPRTLPARQQALRTTLAWSYDLLARREQLLYRRLGVFVGGCTMAAVAAVCAVAGDPGSEVLESLQALLDSSLIRQREGVGGEPRFTMLETIREYALEQLAASGELEQLQRQHAAYFVTLAETGADVPLGQVGAWWDRVEEEHGNFRAALAWSHTQAEGDIGLRLAVALSRFWAQRGHLNEGSGWLAHAVAPYPVGAEPIAATSAWFALLGQALQERGTLAYWQGDFDAALRALEAGLSVFRQLGDSAGIIGVLHALTVAYQERGDYERARILLEEGLVLARELEDDHLAVAWHLFFQGLGAYRACQSGRAAILWDESVARFRAHMDVWAIACVLTHRAMVSLDEGDYGPAGTQLMESLTHLRDLGERWQVVHTLEVFARLAAEQRPRWEDGQPGALRAARLFGAAEALREALGAPVLWFQRQSYAQGVAALRTQLDDAACAAASAEGRGMTLEQAIAYALEGLGS